MEAVGARVGKYNVDVGRPNGKRERGRAEAQRAISDDKLKTL